MKRSLNIKEMEVQAIREKWLDQAASTIRLHSPGLLLVSLLAVLSIFIQKLPGLTFFTPLIIAIVLGVLIRNTIGMAQKFQPGIKFSLKRVLRLAIVLLGLQISLSQMIAVGTLGLSIILITVISTLAFTLWLGQRLGIPPKLVQLIAAGTSICGASAVIASNTVVEDSEENVAYAVAMVTAFGTAAMLFYPPLSGFLHLSPQTYGIWCGASIHEVAQVVATAFQRDSVSGELATVTKLSRVMLLAPTVLGLSVLSLGGSRSSQRLSWNQLPIPWFAFYFILLIGINSLNVLPTGLKEITLQVSQFLLTMAMAAMGLETHLKKLSRAGLKPLYLAAAVWLFIATLSLLLIKLFLPY